jgi:hypothetical protein
VAVVFENGASGAAGFASSLTFALNSGTNSNRCVVVFAGTSASGATTITGATYGGVAMTAHTGFTSAVTGFDGRLFYLGGDSNVASGSNNVVITFSDGNTNVRGLAGAWSGVDGTTPVSGATNAAGGFNNAPTVTVASAAGDMVVFFGIHNQGSVSITPAAPAVEDRDALITGSTYGFILEEAGAASVVINGTLNTTGEWWGSGASLKAAATLRTLTLTADVGTFTLSGQTSNLLKGSALTAEYGAFALTGQDATLTGPAATPAPTEYVGAVGRGRRRVWVEIRGGQVYEVADEQEARKVVRAIKRKAVRQIKHAEIGGPLPDLPAIEIRGEAPFVETLKREIGEIEMDMAQAYQRLFEAMDEDDVETLLL